VSTPPRHLGLLRPSTDGLPTPETQRRRTAVQLVAVLALAASSGYLLWRVLASLDGATWWLAVPLLLLEVHALLGLALFTHDLWDVDVRPVADPDAPGAVDVDTLRVAVLVPTYNEPCSVLLPTVAAAVATRRTHDTWVLDDGDRPWVREMAEELGASYRSRRSGSHAKAGNINDALPQVAADVVAVVDADHVVSGGFLEALLPYFSDPEVAVVQSPQEFYNSSSFEHAARSDGGVYAEQELFYRGLLAGRNRWGAAFWCGTNAAVRVSALESVGGVATDSVTEDIQTTLRLHRRGWRSVHHNEVLAYGLAANDPGAFFIQRNRWGAGAMQVLHRDNPLVGKGLTLHQRLSYLATLLGWFDSWRTIGYVVLPAATIVSGALPVNAPWRTFFVLFLTTFVVQRVALRLLSRGRAPLLHATLFEFVRLPAAFAATIHLFGKGPSTFAVTPKSASSHRSRTSPPRLLAVLMGLTAVSGLWYMLSLAGQTPTHYEVPWVAHGAAFWVAVNGVFLLVATHRIRQERFGGNRRAAWRFGVDVPTTVTRVDRATGDRLPVMLADVSVDGARLLVAGASEGCAEPLVPGDQIVVELPLASGRIEVRAEVRSVWPAGEGADNVGVRFTLSTEAAGAVALALHRVPDRVADPSPVSHVPVQRLVVPEPARTSGA